MPGRTLMQQRLEEARAKEVARKEQELRDRAAGETFKQSRGRLAPAPADAPANPEIRGRTGKTASEMEAGRGTAEEKPTDLTVETAKVVGEGAAMAGDELMEFGVDVYADIVGDESARRNITMLRDMMPDPDTEIGRAIVPWVQFGIPFGAGLKAANLAYKGTKWWGAFAKGSAASGVTAAAFVDPEQEMLLSLTEDIPMLEGPVTDWLRSKDPDDSHWVGRGKNVIEDFALGVAAGGAEKLARSIHGYVRASKAGRPEAGLQGQDRVEVGEATKADVSASRTAAEAVVYPPGTQQADEALNRMATWRAPEVEAAQAETIARRAEEIPATKPTEPVDAAPASPPSADVPTGKPVENIPEPQYRMVWDPDTGEEIPELIVPEGTTGKGTSATYGKEDFLGEGELAANQAAKDTKAALSKAKQRTGLERRLTPEEQASLPPELNRYVDQPKGPEEIKKKEDVLPVPEGARPLGSELPEGGETRTLEAFMAARGVPEEQIGARIQAVDAAIKSFDWKSTDLQKLKGMDAYLDKPEGSIIGDAMTWAAGSESSKQETEAFLKFVRAVSPRVAPKDVASTLAALRSRIAWQSGRTAASGEGAKATGDALGTMSRAIQDLHSSPEESLGGLEQVAAELGGAALPSRLEIALEASENMVKGWNPDLTHGAPITETLAAPPPGRGWDVTGLEKEYAVQAPSTPEEVWSAQAPDFGHHVGDLYWAARRPEMWMDLEVPSMMARGRTALKTPAHVQFSALEAPRDIDEGIKRLAVMRKADVPVTTSAGLEDEVLDQAFQEAATVFGVSPKNIWRASPVDVDRPVLNQKYSVKPGDAAPSTIALKEQQAYDHAVALAKRTSAVQSLEAWMDEAAVVKGTWGVGPTRTEVGTTSKLYRNVSPGQAVEQLDFALAASQDTVHLSRMVAGGESSVAERGAFLASQYRLEAVANTIAGARTRAEQLLKDAKKVEKDPRQALRDHGGNTHVHALAAAVSMEESLDGALRLMRDWKRPDRAHGGRVAWQSVMSMRLASMLSNIPITGARNVGGNLVPPALDIPETFIASWIANGPSGYKEAMFDTSSRVMGQAAGMQMGLRLVAADMGMRWGSIAKPGMPSKIQASLRQRGLDWIYRDFARNQKSDPVRAISEADETAMLNRELISSGYFTFTQKVNRWAQDTALINAPFDPLQFQDMGFKAVSYLGEVYYRAGIQARNEGLTGQALKARRNELVAEHARGDVLNRQGLDHAEMNTFTQEPGELGQKIQVALNAGGQAGRLAVPFYRTINNIWKYAGRHTPFAPVFNESLRALRQGGEPRAREIARIVMGSSFMLYAISELGGTDRLTGNGKAHGYKLRPPGVPNNAVRVGDTWVDYRYFPVLGEILGTIANANEAMAAATTNAENDLAMALWFGTAAAVGTVFEGVWAGDLSEKIDAIRDSSQDPGRAAKVLFGTMGEFAPWQSARTAVDRAVSGGRRFNTRDPSPAAHAAETAAEMAMQEINRVVTKAMAPMGGFTERYPDRDVFGYPVTKVTPQADAALDENGDPLPAPWTSVLYTDLSILAMSKASDDSTIKEMQRLELRFDRPSRTIKERVKNDDRMGGYEMNAKEYDEYTIGAGRWFEREVKAFMKRNDYQELSDFNRRRLVRDLRGHALEFSAQRMREKYPHIRMVLDDWADKRRATMEMRGG